VGVVGGGAGRMAGLLEAEEGCRRIRDEGMTKAEWQMTKE
jgi:hypothetical protein